MIALVAVMDALADYAAVAIVNAHLILSLEKRAKMAYAQLQQHDQQLTQNVQMHHCKTLHQQLNELTYNQPNAVQKKNWKYY